MIELSLSSLAAHLNAHLSGADVRFKGINTDSRKAMHGQLFVALRGDKFDAHQLDRKSVV